MKIPIYYSKVGESEEFLNILPAKLTINEILPHFYKDRWSRPDITIFKEVKIKPYGKHNLDDAEFIAKGKWDRETTYEEVFEYLKKAIYKVWIPDRFHIVGCSSGYDSRLIAKAIIQLTEEHGEKWAGQVVFVEVMGEKPFRDIIKAWGINGIAYNYKSPPNWYHSHGLQFGEFYQKYNGVFAFPFNQWYDAFKDLHEQGKIQKDNIQGFTGYGAGELMRKTIRSQKGFDWYFKYVYRFQLYLFRHWGGIRWEHPFWDYDVMRSLEALPECHVHKRVAIPMARKLVQELNNIPDWQTIDLRENGYRTVAKELLGKLYDDYKKSWFGKKFDIKPSKDINYNKWWFCYNAASLCEYLLKKGHSINL